MTIDKISDGNDIRDIRKALGLNQAEMASRMGLSPRAYFALEQEPELINIRHIRLAEIVSLMEAVERRDRSLVPKSIADLADRFAELSKK
jgi:transcriptional regulator with XRE-family HTH domain